ncbi:MAG: DUF1844 domain-containing protein [Proteobacteria bacterium]|nr:DUF1844 domain-containing protein [Pseudomonadota bacterium]
MVQVESSTVDFSGLILGFCSAALSYMGFGPEKVSLDLRLAQQNIEIIELLLVKTEGNRTPEEEELCREALRDLRQRYLLASR